jgi:hypothetical protein
MADLEALVVAAYVFADECSVPALCGRKPLVTDAELVALAVAQAAIGISSDRQFLGLGRPRLARLVSIIESVFSNLKEQMRLERHLARTPAGLAVRIAQRMLALTLGMLLNTLSGRPAGALAAYDGR